MLKFRPSLISPEFVLKFSRNEIRPRCFGISSCVSRCYEISTSSSGISSCVSRCFELSLFRTHACSWLAPRHLLLTYPYDTTSPCLPLWYNLSMLTPMIQVDTTSLALPKTITVIMIFVDTTFISPGLSLILSRTPLLFYHPTFFLLILMPMFIPSQYAYASARADARRRLAVEDSD